MNIFEVAEYTPHDGTLLSWHCTQKEAEDYIAALKAQRPDAVATWKRHTIGPSTRHLVGWLNIHHQTDNG